MLALPRLIIDFFYNIFSYREYLKQSVARDLRRRYKRSVLGYLWSMLHPLLMMTVLAVVFSKIMQHSAKDYAVFLFAGTLPWAYFTATSGGSLGTIRSNIRIMEQVAVPKYIFPLSIGFSSLADFFLSLVPLFVVMLVLGREIPPTALALPLVLLPLFFVSMGVALIAAASNVFFEDTQHLIEVLFRVLYFLCPVLYSREHLPEWLVHWVVLNPMFCIIEFSRDIFYYGKLPEMTVYAINFAGAFSFLLLGLFIFHRADKKFVYFL